MLNEHFQEKVLSALGSSGWKHGFPFVEEGQDSSKILYICVIRDVDPWIRSMFHNPYHFRYKSMDTFLFDDMEIVNDKKGNNESVYTDEKESGNIFDVRYRKIEAYKKFYNEVENCILINLETVQNYPKEFLEMISANYDLPMSVFKNQNEHTKTGKLHVKNRSYVVKFKDYTSKINHDLESFVNSLKKQFYYKSLML